MKEKERNDGESGGVYIEITSGEHADLNSKIGKVKAFMEIMYGCLSGPTGTDELSDDLLYLVSDARASLEEALAIVNKRE